MASYATPDEARALSFNDDFVELDNDELAAILERASHQVDIYLGWPPPADDFLRIDTDSITPYQAARLRDATISQAAWLLVLDQDQDSLGMDGVVSVGGVTFATVPQSFTGPAVPYLLADAGLFRKDGSAAPTPDPTE
jgi:hypothetical protein